MLDLDGKILAEGEFTQQLEDGVLRIEIAYERKGGGQIEEMGTFRQGKELSQQSWSWCERDGDILLREYKIDFDAGKATARKREKGEMQEWSDEIEIEQGRTFAGFALVVALQNLRKQLVEGATVELKAVGFSPKPRVVGVQLSYRGASRLPMSGRLLRAEHFVIHPQIPVLARLFIKVPDTHIWLTPPPAGFLRWEGPLVEPDDPVVRVDLSGGGESGSAQEPR